MQKYGIKLEKTCSCGEHYTYVGPSYYKTSDDGIWFDCASCKSTMLYLFSQPHYFISPQDKSLKFIKCEKQRRRV